MKDDFMTVCFSNLTQSRERSGRLKKNLRKDLSNISYYNRKIPRGAKDKLSGSSSWKEISINIQFPLV